MRVSWNENSISPKSYTFVIFHICDKEIYNPYYL